MGKEKIKIANETILLTNKLDKFERLNFEEYKVVSSGVIAGLLPVQVTEHRKKTVLEVYSEGMIPLEDALSGRVRTEDFLTVLNATLQIALTCESYGLNPNNLCWELDKVFLHRGSRNIYMLYWPVVHLQNTEYAALEFYLQFSQMMAREQAAPSVRSNYDRFFYQRTSLNFHQFQGLMQTIMEIWRRERVSNITNAGRGAVPRRPEPAPVPPAAPVSRAPSAWLESLSDGRQFVIKKEQMMVGRSRTDCDIAIPHDGSVSRNHALLMTERGYMLVDLGSTNGTYINGHRLPPQTPTPLADGAVVRFGNSQFVFHKPVETSTAVVYQTAR